MATFEYVDIPADAIRLQSSPQDTQSHSIRAARKIFTSLPDSPNSTPAAAPSPWRVQLDGITISPPSAGSTTSTFMSPTKSALSLVPQLLLSSSLPTSASTPSATPSTSTTPSATTTFTSTTNPRAPPHSLLSTRDPLSLPIMTSNFRRFVAKIGPVFWLQDRVEEVILWKKGWRRTTVWLAVYGFLCYFPKMALLLPHALLLGIMLAYYPDPGKPSIPINVSEGTVDWQANIQAIQNLMGVLSDVHDALLPIFPLLTPPPTSQPPAPPPPSPTRSHFKSASTSTSTILPSSLSPSSDPSCTPKPKPSPAPAQPLSQPQPHHPPLILTLLSFLMLLPLLASPYVPLRLLFFLFGAGGVGCMHPFLRARLPGLIHATRALLSSGFTVPIPTLPTLRLNRARKLRFFPTLSSAPRASMSVTAKKLCVLGRQVWDDDRLEDAVWSAGAMGRVELWENERWVGGAGGRRGSVVGEGTAGEEAGEERESGDTSVGGSSRTMDLGADRPVGTWSKSNLRANERSGWTRGRDGWSGVGAEVSSNLTFSLSPDWAFVETEGWRADLEGGWVQDMVQCVADKKGGPGADEDGWIYTTDTWAHPRADARPGEGWVTRRRRWPLGYMDDISLAQRKAYDKEAMDLVANDAWNDEAFSMPLL
ncbi:hypothetical protein HYDPIDRAFT_33002 [Hydnomerulius pinastri MD-312]|uniref:Unplaced genomic scaffold scaffold_49, whole genome shotgun sequence n=1 Tax=Hydnomerulius pinastri MD-312 TaxID=994086 RepID=A0A0C9V320_9AGAM|nr:hypothetical protein HYDPIDRAFT_33002 [Hydnomerulius pinastri MD-312]